MSVKRYALEHERGESNTFGCPDGDYVLFKDYAALEARCAGLELERDAAFQEVHTVRNEAQGVYSKNGMLIVENRALQAKLAAASDREKRLKDVLLELVEVATLRGDNDLPHPSDDPLLWTGRMQDAWIDAAAALADTTTDEVQP